MWPPEVATAVVAAAPAAPVVSENEVPMPVIERVYWEPMAVAASAVCRAVIWLAEPVKAEARPRVKVLPL